MNNLIRLLDGAPRIIENDPGRWWLIPQSCIRTGR